MTYSVKEIFYTLQGEGGQAGTPAVFCRFAGCNLWTGREQDRAQAICQFCDTDFVGTDGLGGGKFADAAELAALVDTLLAARPTQPESDSTEESDAKQGKKPLGAAELRALAVAARKEAAENTSPQARRALFRAIHGMLA